jgi:hypothetical protein
MHFSQKRWPQMVDDASINSFMQTGQLNFGAFGASFACITLGSGLQFIPIFFPIKEVTYEKLINEKHGLYGKPKRKYILVQSIYKALRLDSIWSIILKFIASPILGDYLQNNLVPTLFLCHAKVSAMLITLFGP